MLLYAIVCESRQAYNIYKLSLGGDGHLLTL